MIISASHRFDMPFPRAVAYYCPVVATTPVTDDRRCSRAEVAALSGGRCRVLPARTVPASAPVARDRSGKKLPRHMLRWPTPLMTMRGTKERTSTRHAATAHSETSDGHLEHPRPAMGILNE